MFKVTYYCGHSDEVFTESFDTVENAREFWDSIQWKRHIHMHGVRP